MNKEWAYIHLQQGYGHKHHMVRSEIMHGYRCICGEFAGEEARHMMHAYIKSWANYFGGDLKKRLLKVR